jgi:hypothetical protein
MANDLVPEESNNAVESFTEKLNLPQMIAGPAGKAISRLVAGVIEIPAAFLDSFAQSIKDKTTARSTVSNEVAKAAAKLASDDKDIVARAAHNLLAKEYRHQKNKEEIAKKAIEILQEQTGNERSAPNKDAKEGDYVDEDWLNVFEKYAQDASSERLQKLWAQILAGEIRKTKSFSLKTLRFVSELDQRIATVFEAHVPYICDDAIFTPEDLRGKPFVDLMDLQDAGLISGVGGLVHKIITLSDIGQAMLRHQNTMILIEGKPGIKINVPAALLTTIGKEIIPIIRTEFNADFGKKVAERIPKENVTSISYAGIQGSGAGAKFVPKILLWTPSTSSPS